MAKSDPVRCKAPLTQAPSGAFFMMARLDLLAQYGYHKDFIFLSSMTNPTAPVLPAWARHLGELFLAREASIFVVHGNVQDLVLYQDRLMPFSQFLAAWMEKLDEQGRRQAGGKTLIPWPIYDKEGYSKGVMGVLADMDRKWVEDTCLYMPHAQALLPMGDPQYRSADERRLLAAVQDWAMDPERRKMNALMILVTESLTSVASELLSNPYIATVEVPLPDWHERRQVIAMQRGARSYPAQWVDKFATHTAGMKRVQIESVFNVQRGLSETVRRDMIEHFFGTVQNQEADEVALGERIEVLTQITGGMTAPEITHLLQNGTPQDEQSAMNAFERKVLALLHERKRRIIEKECAGLIEFMDTSYGLDDVGGSELLKSELRQIAQVMRSGNKSLMPMGLLAVGAMGAGKTYVIKAFLHDAGLTGLTLKNFRSKWVGSTEANLDKVLSTIRAMGPVALVLDESDRSFGTDEGDGDGGTSSRVIARLKSFMSEPENRGQVLFVLLTNRPDKLDPDIKRPGRLDRKIPFFYADTPEELAGLAKSIARRYQVPEDALGDPQVFLPCMGYSNADVEALVGLYANLLAQHAADADAPADVETQKMLLARAVEDFIPPREQRMVDYMNLLAVKEASRKSLLPVRYHTLLENGGELLNTQLDSLRPRRG